MDEFQQKQLIAEIVGKAIESGKIKMEVPQPPMHPRYPIQQFPVQEEKVEEPKAPSYEGVRLTIFDLLTCIMFTLNLIGVTDINWFLVFLPFAIPYILFYGAIWCIMIWAKIKEKKNKEDGETNIN